MDITFSLVYIKHQEQTNMEATIAIITAATALVVAIFTGFRQSRCTTIECSDCCIIKRKLEEGS